ncbi:MAG TPA: HEAT repeat domain-containing protein [Candidatus Sulfopaludibacter sp.]|jgi:HEAT repeat protein|nr:HEAT repeat domain-containing protein [Candidatus Sulfopaludibacter sp.]
MHRALILAITTLIPAYAATPVDAAWDTLHKSLSKSQEQKRQALTALGAVDPGNQQAVKELVDALQDKEPLVRQAAAAALGEMKAKQAIGSLRDATGDRGEVAFAAAKALADMGDSGGQDMFVAMIAGERSDAPGIVAGGIRDARKRLKHPQGLLLEGVEDAGGALFPPAGYGITAAREAFKEKGSSSRAVAASYLAKCPEPYAVTLLEWALSDSSWGVRMAAAKGLAQRGNAGTISKLQFLLDDPKPAVATMAAAAILRITDRLAEGATAQVSK